MKEKIQALLQNWSMEVTPRLAGKLSDMREYLPEKTFVYVTFLPGSDFNATIKTCRKLQDEGMKAVPHMALRNFSAKLPMRDALMRLMDMGVRDILLLAGGGAGNAKSPGCVPELLEQGWFGELPLESVGFAAHPEGNPLIREDALRSAEAVKYAYAQHHPGYYYFITQFCFSPEPLLAWMAGLHEREMVLPVHVGIPGLASRKSLLRHARHCGVGASAQYLRRNLMNWRNLFSPRQPDNIIYALAQAGEAPVRRLHFYPLGAFEATLAWIKAIEAGQFALHHQGFRVYA